MRGAGLNRCPFMQLDGRTVHAALHQAQVACKLGQENVAGLNDTSEYGAVARVDPNRELAIVWVNRKFAWH